MKTSAGFRRNWKPPRDGDSHPALDEFVKHLHVDWRAGEAWFAVKLVDYGAAQNEGNWQWVAGTGIDAQPWFRILDPELQRSRFDPEGAYCRRWVPEWGTSAYPRPMVDLAAEAAEAKERYRNAHRSDR